MEMADFVSQTVGTVRLGDEEDAVADRLVMVMRFETLSTIERIDIAHHAV